MPLDKFFNVTMSQFLDLCTGLQGLASENTECPMKFQFQMNHKYFFSICMSQILYGTYAFKFNWVACILSANPTYVNMLIIVPGTNKEKQFPMSPSKILSK